MRVPLANATFDAVVMVHVLHLVDDWRAVLDEARRLLRPGAPLVLGFDEHPDADDPERQSHARWQVYPRWRAILADLGHTSRSTRGSREFGEPSEAYLRERGATVTVDRIFSYPGHAISARQAAARLIGRQQSGEWLLPDDVHDEASRRLQHWLDEECADPDTPVPQTSAFKVIVARFPR
jgi:SAM-dependent methyltransferase